jgi:uncharacterized protein YciW
METLPKDVLTLIFTNLSTQSRLALLSAIPQLAIRVDWNVLYQQKYNPLMDQFRKLHSKYFTITKSDRLAAMLQYYSKTTYHPDDEDNYEKTDADYRLRDIPILDTSEYKVQDYEYDITDYIYDDILKIKWNSLNK